MLVHRVKAIGFAFVALAGGCTNGINGAQAKVNIEDHRGQTETTPIVQEENQGIDDKEVRHLLARINSPKAQDVPTNTDSRSEQSRRLDALFRTCSKIFDQASPDQQVQLSDAIQSLLVNNSFAARQANRQYPDGLCGVVTLETPGLS